eukprot:15463588-Alexandrium_andersonii.AAC.1
MAARAARIKTVSKTLARRALFRAVPPGQAHPQTTLLHEALRTREGSSRDAWVARACEDRSVPKLKLASSARLAKHKARSGRKRSERAAEKERLPT